MMNLTDFESVVEKIFVNDLELARSIRFERLESKIYLRVEGSIFKELTEKILKNYDLVYIGDPIISAIACIISKITKEPIVVIENIMVDGNQQIIYESLDFIDTNDYVEIYI
jgi:hypothetical protein